MKNNIQVCKNCDHFFFTDWKKSKNILQCIKGIKFGPNWDNYNIKDYERFEVPEHCEYYLEHMVMEQKDVV